MIHRTALVDSSAQVGRDVTIEPYTIIGPHVVLGDGCVIGPHAVLERNVRLGQGVRIGAGTVLGGPPQDVKYKGEETWVEIGDATVIREYCTVNRGTAATGKTTVGARCFIMTYVHFAHDCHIGNDVIVANAVQMAGHVRVDDRAIISGLTPIHQFVRVGESGFTAGGAMVAQDVPPFSRVAGDRARFMGLNTVNLERRGFEPDRIAAIKHAFHLLMHSKLRFEEACGRIEQECAGSRDVAHLLAFLRSAERGFIRS